MLSGSAIADALELSEARGAELLVALAGAQIWRGNLPVMRGDDPRNEQVDLENTEPDNAVIDRVLLARAIEMLTPSCRHSLIVAYGRRGGTPPVEEIGDLLTKNSHVIECRERLTEIFVSLRSFDAVEQIPSWVFEREHAATGGQRRR